MIIFLKESLIFNSLASNPHHAFIIFALLSVVLFKSYLGGTTITTTTMKETTRTTNLLPPMVKCSVLTALRTFGSTDSPFKVLRWAKEYGPLFRVRLLKGKTMFISNDLTITRTILGDKESYKPQDVYQGGGSTRGENTMFNSEGFRWRHVRKSVAHAFSTNHIRRMMEVSHDKTNALIDKLDQWVDERVSFDLCAELLTLTFQIICEAAFEYDISQEEILTFLEDTRITSLERKKSRFLPVRKRLGRFLKGVKDSEESKASMGNFGKKVLISYKKKKKHDTTQKGTIMDCIVNDKDYESDAERVRDILVFLFAGHDTTAFSMAWILLELAKHPHEQEALRNELNKVPMEERSNNTSMKNVVKEGMRLYPVAANASARGTAKDITITLNDSERTVHTIPKDSTIICPIFLLHRNPKYYDEPDKFKPSRWVDPSPEALSAFMPFSMGRRNCIGQALATAELHSVLPRLICRYHFSVFESGQREYYSTMKPTGSRLIATKVSH